MLDRLIKFSLKHRLIVLVAATILLLYGAYTFYQLPVDVLPDLNRSRVTVFLEADGMAPEEVETQVLLPAETALSASPGVETVRSVASAGLGMVFVEFDWDTDVYRARQLTAEKLQTIVLPPGVTPVMGPVSSVMGQIMLIAVTGDKTGPMDIRTLADNTIRRRLMAIKGIAQVVSIGGELMQYQVLVSPQKLRQLGISVGQVDEALGNSNANTSGGFMQNQGSEVLIRNISRIKPSSLDDIRNTVVGYRDNSPVLLRQVADIRLGAAVKRGEGSLNGKPAVILSVEKQPDANTLELTRRINDAIAELQPSLPEDIKINSDIFQQRSFIVNALKNVEEALRDGFILVVIVLFMFLLNFRTTLITLTAIPLSLVISALVFQWFDISMNTLTLGGIAIAIGELVDDAIVDVENVFRRLKENWASPHPKPVLSVIYEASSEVRNSIVYATIIVILVFLPLFFLQGIEGKIFSPLGIAYITSIAASLVVSLTVTPALCSFLFGAEKALKPVDLKFWKKGRRSSQEDSGSAKESFLVRFLKMKDTRLLDWGLNHPRTVIGSAVMLIVTSISIVPFFGTEFLPEFNEGSYTVNLSLPAGTSLEQANKIGSIAEQQLLKVPEVVFTARRTGRAELDEHAEPPSNSEIEVALKSPDEIDRSKQEILADLRAQLAVLKGVSVNIGQPISHRLDHLLSGVRAQIAIKVFGNDLAELRNHASKIRDLVHTVPGIVDVQMEKQVLVPQLLIKMDRAAVQRYGLHPGEVAEDLEIFHNGKVKSQVIDGLQTFDLVLRTDDSTRNSVDAIRKTPISLPDGSLVSLEQLASVGFESGIHVINHENSQRRIIVSANVQGRDLGGAVREVREKLRTGLQLPQGYFLEYGGQFESQRSASRLILILSLFSFAGIFLVLYSHFNSAWIAGQIMLNIPLALVGSVVSVMLTGWVFSVATLVGFITLTGIASRNGILMISHYIHLVENEGEQFSRQMIIRGSLERLVPVLMTALTAGLALIPLTLDATAAGKEILYPVATVILGGLVSSTLLDMVVTPVVFYTFGRKALNNYLRKKHKDVFPVLSESNIQATAVAG